MEQLRGRLLGNWKVLHVDGHVEKRKKDRKTWTFEEIGNDKSDLIAGRCMRAAAQDGRDDAAALVKWNAQVDAHGRNVREAVLEGDLQAAQGVVPPVFADVLRAGA
jgi:hypothetical protein